MRPVKLNGGRSRRRTVADRFGEVQAGETIGMFGGGCRMAWQNVYKCRFVEQRVGNPYSYSFRRYYNY